MAKLKTKSSIKKRFEMTASGKIKFKAARKRHNMRTRSKTMLRDTKHNMYLCDADQKFVKRNFMASK